MSNTYKTPKFPNMTTSANSLPIVAPSSKAQEYLQPPKSVPISLSSNSSSVKSMTSKWNDGASAEKKRKPSNSSRQKKFHRQFKQVSMDEEVINCA